MLNIMRYVRDRLECLRNQRGAETAEWIIIVGLIAVVAFIVYAAPTGPLVTGLTTMVTATVAAIQAALTAALP